MTYDTSIVSDTLYTVKRYRRFYGKYWQRTASACTENFTGASNNYAGWGSEAGGGGGGGVGSVGYGR